MFTEFKVSDGVLQYTFQYRPQKTVSYSFLALFQRVQEVSNSLQTTHNDRMTQNTPSCFAIYLSYFEKGCRKKCARDNPGGNTGYDQFTVPDTVAVEPAFVTFL